jgi:3',5'-cyclic AMP phosphodiesterase CpdA
MTVCLTREEEEAQDRWLRAELAKPKIAPFLAAVAHHPLYSNGMHGDTKSLISAWDGLLREHGVHFYFSGHDHDLQHLEFEGHPVSFVVSGAGGAIAREQKLLNRGPFSVGSIHGFSEWRITPERFVVRHYDTGRKLLHGFAKTPDGKVTLG